MLQLKKIPLLENLSSYRPHKNKKENIMEEKSLAIVAYRTDHQNNFAPCFTDWKPLSGLPEILRLSAINTLDHIQTGSGAQ
jgi:hypothetical protein